MINVVHPCKHTLRTKASWLNIPPFICLGASLDTSPEGLLSFVLEKISVGANKHNIHLTNAGLDAYNITTLLDTFMFYYWFPKTAATSARFYAENLNLKAVELGIYE